MSRVLDRILSPIRSFTRLEAAGGILLMATALFALIWANSPFADSYHAIWKTYLTVEVAGKGLSKALILWINDGLMALFFLLVGLEIKREVLDGELASPRKAALPIAAAIGGMVIPATFYVLASGPDVASGWGIPMATDIAFALGILLLLGSRAPLALKIFLTAVAIVDDLGAVLVIALFYTAELNTTALMWSAVLLATAFAANRLGVRALGVYWIIGSILWFAVLKSGIHATIAGVALALMIPMDKQSEALDGDHHDAEGHDHAHDSPLHKLEHGLHPWIAFFVMPVFAFANAGVTIGGGEPSAFGSQVILGIGLGLVLGKPIGVMAAAWVAVKAGIAELPSGVSWRQMFGVSALCGVGFTMSLFIGGLAFDDAALLDSAKMGILMASGISALIGTGALLAVGTKKIAAADPAADPVVATGGD